MHFKTAVTVIQVLFNTNATWRSHQCWITPVLQFICWNIPHIPFWFLAAQPCWHIIVEISTEVCTSCNNKCTLQWISQQPMMIETCFNFLNTLPMANESICITWIYLHWKKLIYEFGRLKVNKDQKWMKIGSLSSRLLGSCTGYHWHLSNIGHDDHIYFWSQLIRE